MKTVATKADLYKMALEKGATVTDKDGRTFNAKKIKAKSERAGLIESSMFQTNDHAIKMDDQ